MNPKNCTMNTTLQQVVLILNIPCDSRELSMINCLNLKNYLITDDLHNILINEVPVAGRNNRSISQIPGIYIILFTLVNIKGKDVIIYKYIKYSYILYECLFYYIWMQSNTSFITKDNSIGSKFLFVIDNDLFPNK